MHQSLRKEGHDGRPSLPMAARVAAFDWAATPLGPREDWPASLRSSLRLILDSRFPMFLWWGPELINLYNDAYVAVLGDRHPEALGQPAREIWREIWDTIGPEAEEVLRTGQPSWKEVQPYMLERFGYLEETYFTFSFSAIADESGAIRGLFCACVEETQRVLSARRLGSLRAISEAMARTESVEEACAAAACAAHRNAEDLPFVLIYLCGEDVGGCDLAAGAGLVRGCALSPLRIDLAPGAGSPWPFAGLLERPSAQVVAIEATESSGPWPEPVTQAVVAPLSRRGLERPDGFAVIGVSPRRELDGDYLAFAELVAQTLAAGIANARAFEAEKRRIAALEQLDRAKTAFFGNVSHELRTPLTLILGPISDLLSEAAGLTSAEREQLAIAQRSTWRLAKLVDALLDFSRLEDGGRASFEPVDLSAATAELASAFHTLMEHVGVRLSVDCPELPQPVWVDRELWDKIVLNLLSNAFKYTWEGEVRVALAAQPESVDLEVSDTGTGISAEDLPHVCERFFRAPDAHGRTSEGTGIGLALVQELVQQHGGTLEVESELGRGSTFRVRLPWGREHLPQSSPRRRPAPAGAAAERTGRFVDEAAGWLSSAIEPAAWTEPGDEAAPELHAQRILLCEDNADMQGYLSRLLAERFDVVRARNGAEALEALERQLPDLVLSDVTMPLVDGLELARRMRADARTRNVPILLISARAGEEAKSEALKSGADDYVTKPFYGRELLGRITALLELAELRRRAAAEEQRHAALLQATVDLVPISILYLDPDRTFRFANTIYADLHGLTPGQMVGRHVSEIMSADKYRELLPYMDKAFAGESFSVRRTLPYGRLGMREVLTSFRPVSDERGAVEGIVVAVQDVTVAAEMARALRESEESFQVLADNIAQLAWMAGPDGWIFWFNRRWHEYTGKPFEDMQGWGWERVLDTDARREVRASWKRALATGTSWELEFLLRGADGQSRWFLTRAEPIKNPAGKIVRWFGTNTDVDLARRLQIDREALVESERAARMALEKAARLKDEFLATISHELRTPLNAILGWTHVLRSVEESPELSKGLDVIERNARLQAELVADLLDMSRIATGKLRLDMQPVELHSIVAAALDAAQPMADAKGLALSRDLAELGECVAGDSARLQQIVGNFISNAIKFTPEYGRIDVALRAADGFARIEVTDTGKGIDPDFLPHLFERFRQEDASAARQHGGMGLGLALVKQLTELHGGRVHASSPGPGRGATFTVELPLVASEAVGRPSAPPDADSRAASSAARQGPPGSAPGAASGPLLADLEVLVVDDAADARRLVRRLLEEHKARVFEVASAAEALEFLAGHSPEVLISDIGMPGEDGYALIAAVRAAGHALPAAALTAYSRPEDRERALAAGFQAYVPKPLEPLELIATVAQLAGRAQSY